MEGGPANHIATENPMLVLHAGEEYKCDEAYKYAMRLIVKENMTSITSYPPILPPKVYVDIFNHRTKRAQALSSILVPLVSKLIQDMEMEMDRMLKGTVMASVKFRPYPDHGPRKHGTQESSTPPPCCYCRTIVHNAISDIARMVMVHPSWDALSINTEVEVEPGVWNMWTGPIQKYSEPKVRSTRGVPL
jgi:hypothetical protein